MGQLLPVLKPSGYRKDTPLFFKERLFDDVSAPVIAFGTDEGIRIAYEAASSEEEYKGRLSEIKKQALENLKSIEPEIQVQDAQGAKIAFVMGHEYASEKILDVEYMKLVGQAIGSNSLLVGIPYKGNLIATDSNSSIRLKFPPIIAKYYNNADQEPISDKVFLVNDGEIVAMAGENIPDDGGPDKFIITEIASNNNYKVDVRCNSIEELTDTVSTSFQQVMSMIMQRKVFGGEVSYHIGDGLPKDQQLIDKCNSYCQQVASNELAQSVVGVLANKGASLSFYHQGEKIAPAESSQAPKNGMDYSDLSEEELRDEFYRIVSIPNARTNMEALTAMTGLMKEYDNRGVKMPNPRFRPAVKSKKWWQFWK